MATKHKKLSDVERETTYLIPRTPTTFSKAYPEVESIRVEIRPKGEGFRPIYKEREYLIVYDQNSLKPIVDCRNPRCYGGGLHLDELLRWQVVDQRRTEFQEEVSCRGYEGTPKGRRRDGPCDTYFDVKVSVTYKAEEASGEAQSR